MLAEKPAPEAVRWLASLATRRNEYVKRVNSTRSGKHSRLAAISQTRSAANNGSSMYKQSAAGARPREQRSQQSVRDRESGSENGGRDSRVLHRENLVQAICRRYNLDANVVRQRLDDNVCARCAKSGHDIRGCPAGNPSTSAPAAAANPAQSNTSAHQ
jgi:hypothetical protein